MKRKLKSFDEIEKSPPLNKTIRHGERSPFGDETEGGVYSRRQDER